MKNSETTMPLVTIGIPTYNRPKGLCHVLECAIRQTYRNIEILIADNCTEPAEYLHDQIKYYLQDARVVYYRHERNFGPLYNFEFLLRKARGKYFIWFSDDDDFNDTELIEKYVRVLESAPHASAAMCSVEYIDGDGEIFLLDKPPYHLDGSLIHRIWTYLTTDITDNLMYGMIRTEFVKDFEFERDVHTPEKFFILFLLSKGPIVDCFDASYRNINSFKSPAEIEQFFGKPPTRSHTLVWVKSAFRYLPIMYGLLFSIVYILLRSPKISWPLRKLLSLPKPHPNRKFFKEPTRRKFSNE